MLNEFNQIYFKEISYRIEKQQIEFDLARIHSHRHISRCLVYSEWILKRLQHELDYENNLDLLFAISFHDIGRIQEGIDNTNYQASLIAQEEMIKMNVDERIIESTKKLIKEKDNSDNYDIKRMILHDVDCFDIMRPSTGRGGIIGFNKDFLCLFKSNQNNYQNELISKCFNLINITENELFENVDCLKNILKSNLNE